MLKDLIDERSVCLGNVNNRPLRQKDCNSAAYYVVIGLLLLKLGNKTCGKKGVEIEFCV